METGKHPLNLRYSLRPIGIHCWKTYGTRYTNKCL